MSNITVIVICVVIFCIALAAGWYFAVRKSLKKAKNSKSMQLQIDKNNNNNKDNKESEKNEN